MRKRSLLNLFLVLPLLAASMLTFTACDSDELSPRLAKNALEDSPLLRDSCITQTFSTGYYEVNAEDTVQLGQLKRAGMITYTTETVIEKRKRYSYSWYSGSSYYTENVEHIFATVELTEEGKKLEVTNKPLYRSVYEKALGLLDEKEEIKEPAYLSGEADKEAKKDKKEADVATSTDSEAVDVDSVAVDTAVAVEEDFVEEEPQPATTGKSGDAYEVACAKVNKVKHEMLIGFIKIVKVIDVFCPEDYRKSGIGECNFVYELDDLTPFAWVFGDKEKLHERNLSSAKFKHTVDEGWYVTKIGNDD